MNTMKKEPQMTERKFTPPTTFPAEYVTRDGRKAVVVARINGPAQLLIAVITDVDGEERVAQYYENGRYQGWQADRADLIDKPETVTDWMNVYSHGIFGRYTRREQADQNAYASRLNVLRITTCKETGKLIECLDEGVH